MESNNKLVSIINLNKSYSHKEILKNLNLDIMIGDCIGILGANGSGKTTLAKLIAKIEAPSSGIIKYFFNEESNNNISFQFLNYTWPIGIKVKNLIDLYCGVYKIDANDSWIQELITLIDFQGSFKKTINKLKNFEKELLTLLLALIPKPKLLILNEISPSLSFDLHEKIFNFLKQQILVNNLTIVIINPNPNQVEALCNKVIVIKQHHQIEELNVANVLTKYKNFQSYLHSHLEE